MGLISAIFGDQNEKEIKRISKIADKIEALDATMQSKTDEELRDYTRIFKERLANGETLDDILVEAFAVEREASWRVLNKKPYYVQLIGGIILHQGRCAEMRTGEGKTFVAPLAAYLNALAGNGVHIVTVNEYLAKTQCAFIGKIFTFLGLSCGLILHEMTAEDRRKNYGCDVTYVTNNELGFDYLRDNMVKDKSQMVIRDLNFAIIDEVDSILIDEARTPLIISGTGDKSTSMYFTADKFASRLTADDYGVDEKAKTVYLTDSGNVKAEKFFGIENLADADNIEIQHHVQQALKARYQMKRDVDYVVKDGQALIVDEFTGRLMIGRRFSDGLHQAIEAKEGLKVERESITLATITFQNFFRMYKKLSGMTGTAKTEESEFKAIYALDVVVVPTNKPMIREDMNDVVYAKERSKYAAIVEDIVECSRRGQPVLVGTVSVEKSEMLSAMLKRRGVKHQVLNAKYHDREAEIVAQAGRLNTVTIATNMAGRGTDIMLGGNPEIMAKQEMKREGYTPEVLELVDTYEETSDEDVIKGRAVFAELVAKYKVQTDAEKEKVTELGGLYIIGTERHESRRIDNQLRGRAGRQGDPGRSRFYVSLEDELMRLFGSDRLQGIMETLNPQDNTPLEMGMLSKQIESAQKRVEGRNFSIRKSVLQYDDVMNRQRELIYDQRRRVLEGENVNSFIMDMIDTVVEDIVMAYTAESDDPLDYNFEGMIEYIESVFMPKGALVFTDKEKREIERKELIERIKSVAKAEYRKKEEENSEQIMRELERYVLLTVVDTKWRDHIDAMSQLREGVGLRAYANRDPIMEYKKESFDMFDEMSSAIQRETLKMLFNVKVSREGVPQRSQQSVDTNMRTNRTSDGVVINEPNRVKSTVVAKKLPGRNDPCPCGSGKKYKQCCALKENGANNAAN